MAEGFFMVLIGLGLIVVVLFVVRNKSQEARRLEDAPEGDGAPSTDLEDE